MVILSFVGDVIVNHDRNKLSFMSITKIRFALRNLARIFEYIVHTRHILRVADDAP